MKFATLIFPDPASQNIKSHLDSSIKTYDVNSRCVDAEDIDKKIEADVFIFATTHTSKSGIPSLSVHPIGNFSSAELGGKQRTLIPCQANILRHAFLKLKELNTLSHETILECTHHGPYLEKPAIFIEIGSSEKEWGNQEAGKIIAEVIKHITQDKIPETPTAIAIGGLHTCPEISKILLRSNLSIGHVCPKYQLEHLDEEMLKEMINKTFPKPELAILDWKGLGEHKEDVICLLREMDFPYKKTKDYSK